MKNSLGLLGVSLCLALSVQAEERSFVSPDGKIKVVVTDEQGTPDYTVSYHTKGEEIYWRFYQSTHTCPRDKRLAEALSASTGYPVREAKGSAGGYKDWCIQRFKIPAFTVETGQDCLKHPIKSEGLKDIIEKNEKSLNDLTKEYLRLL